MRNFLHDSLSSRTMCMINVYPWSSKKVMIHRTRSAININSFTDIGRTYLKRAVLESERSFLIMKLKSFFAEQNYDFFMNLTNREMALLVLDKRICWSRSFCGRKCLDVLQKRIKKVLSKIL